MGKINKYVRLMRFEFDDRLNLRGNGEDEDLNEFGDILDFRWRKRFWRFFWESRAVRSFVLGYFGNFQV